MLADYLFVSALGIGFVAGLRSMLAPAVMACAAHAAWLNLEGSPLSFIGSTTVMIVLCLFALGELAGDKFPRLPKRTGAAPLAARMITGGLSGACLFASAKHSLGLGAAMGAAGAIVGAFAGYNGRQQVVTRSRLPDLVVALAEDLVAIGLALFFVSR